MTLLTNTPLGIKIRLLGFKWWVHWRRFIGLYLHCSLQRCLASTHSHPHTFTHGKGITWSSEGLQCLVEGHLRILPGGEGSWTSNHSVPGGSSINMYVYTCLWALLPPEVHLVPSPSSVLKKLTAISKPVAKKILKNMLSKEVQCPCIYMFRKKKTFLFWILTYLFAFFSFVDQRLCCLKGLKSGLFLTFL